MPITVISENKDHWEQILFLPENRILHCCRSRRILLIHKAHQSMFHTMQAMCILLHKPQHTSWDSCGISIPQSKKKLKNQWVFFFRILKQKIFKAKVLLFRFNLGIEISVTWKMLGGFKHDPCFCISLKPNIWFVRIIFIMDKFIGFKHLPTWLICHLLSAFEPRCASCAINCERHAAAQMSQGAGVPAYPRTSVR